MPFTVTMPKLSPTMEEGAIAKWHKKEGDQVEAGDLLLEVSTDKATVEYNALDSGWLRKILIKDGEEAYVNQAIAIFTETKDENIEGYQPEGVKVKEAETLPKYIEDVTPKTEGSLPEGSGSKKVTTTFQQPLFAPEQPLETYQFEFPTEKLEKRLFASPLAKKIAREKGLDITTVKGSGPNQRVMSRDLEKAQPAGDVAFGRRETPTIPPGSYEEESLSPMRKVIAQRLQEAKTFIPHFYLSQEINATPLFEIREQLRNHEIKLTYNDFVVRACALTLKKHPVVNSCYISQNQTIAQFKTIDISIAVSVKGGLVTPIIRHADYKNLGEVSLEVRHLAKKAKEGKLEAHEYKGGSFTISNLGMYGITEFKAIINPPQAAILAVGGIFDRPIIRNGQIVVGKVMNVTLSVDHRVVDGVAAAEFLKTLQGYLENPAVLMV